MSAEPELPEELRAMLAADAEEIAPPPGAREQVFDRVLVSVGVTAAVAASATTASAASAAKRTCAKRPEVRVDRSVVCAWTLIVVQNGKTQREQYANF